MKKLAMIKTWGPSMENKEIPEQIVNFLKSQDGRDYFRKIVEQNGLIRKKSVPVSRQAIHWKRKSFLSGKMKPSEHALILRLLEPMSLEWGKYVDNVNYLLDSVK